MTRLNALLLLVLVASSLYLVKIAYDSRRLFVALDRAQAEERTLETDYERLQIDKRGQATPLRVESVAREKLAMRTATPAVTQYVTAGAAAVGAAQAFDSAVPLRPGEVPPLMAVDMPSAGRSGVSSPAPGGTPTGAGTQPQPVPGPASRSSSQPVPQPVQQPVPQGRAR